MKSLLPMPVGLLATAGLILICAGCQSYEPAPLDLDQTRQSWLSRLPSDEAVKVFSDRLTAQEGQAPGVFDLSDGLSLWEAEPVALVYNPDLRLARLRVNIARAGAENAGLWEDPVASVDLERILRSVSEPWIVGTTLGITLPISGRLEVEKALANAELAAELQNVAAQEWATRSAVRELWVGWSAQRARWELTEQLADQLKDVVQLALKQEASGSLARIEARVFEVELASRQADATALRARTTEMEIQLRLMLGLSPQAAVKLVPLVIYTPRITQAAALQQTMDQTNPELLAVRSRYAAFEEGLRLEVRKQYPDLTIGPGYKNEDGGSRLLFSAAMPLPIWNRNQQALAQADARRELAKGEFATTYEHLSAKLAIALSRYQAGREVREKVQSTVVPLADEQETQVRQVASLGRVDPLLILQALQAQHEAKVRLVDACAAESTGAVQLDELVGPVSLVTTQASETSKGAGQ